MFAVPAFTFWPYTTKQTILGFDLLILFKTSSSDKFSAFASNILALKPTARMDWASNKAQVGGSIAEYVLDNFW